MCPRGPAWVPWRCSLLAGLGGAVCLGARAALLAHGQRSPTTAIDGAGLPLTRVERRAIWAHGAHGSTELVVADRFLLNVMQSQAVRGRPEDEERSE